MVHARHLYRESCYMYFGFTRVSVFRVNELRSRLIDDIMLNVTQTLKL